MPYQPQTRAQRREQIIDALSGETPNLTNFNPDTPNWVICDWFAAEWVDYDHIALATQLSAWVDYAGGPVGDDALLDLGLDPDRIDTTLLNSLLDDGDLDALAAQAGLSRIPGSKAQGEVVFGTAEAAVSIPSGTRLATERIDVGADYQEVEFVTTSEVTSAQGDTSVTASIEALELGTEGNVGAGQITRVVDDPVGVQGVTNPEPTSGGEGPETNTELRQRIKSAPTETSGGGTAAGVEGAVVDGIAGIEADDVDTIEYPAPVDTGYLSGTLGLQLVDDLSTISSPANGDVAVASGDGPDTRGVYVWDNSASEWHGPLSNAARVDVVVDGGTDTDVEDVIDAAKPAGVQHDLVRPTALTVDIDVEVFAQFDTADVDADRVGDALSAYVSDLGLGEDVYRPQITETTMDTDEDIATIDSLTVTVDGSTVAGDVTVATDEVARAGSMTVSVTGTTEG